MRASVSQGPLIEEKLKDSTKIEIYSKLLASVPLSHACHYMTDDPLAAIAARKAKFNRIDPNFRFVARFRDRDHALQSFKKKLRSDIHRANVTVAREYDVASFFVAYRSHLREKRETPRDYTGPEAEVFANECLARTCGRIYAAFRSDKMPEAVLFVPNDKNYSYYFLSSRHPNAHSGSMSTLIFEAIVDANEAGRAFDFLGLYMPTTVDFYLGFGGKLEPFWELRRTSVAWESLRLVNRAVRKARGDEWF